MNWGLRLVTRDSTSTTYLKFGCLARKLRPPSPQPPGAAALSLLGDLVTLVGPGSASGLLLFIWSEALDPHGSPWCWLQNPTFRCVRIVMSCYLSVVTFHNSTLQMVMHGEWLMLLPPPQPWKNMVKSSMERTSRRVVNSVASQRRSLMAPWRRRSAWLLMPRRRQPSSKGWSKTLLSK